MSHRFFILSLIAGISLLFPLAGACGGGGDEMTLEAYLTELDAIFDEVDERFAAQEEGDEELTEDSSVQEIKDSVLAGTDEFTEIIQDATDKVKELDPPDELKDEHEELVDGLEQFPTGLDAYREQVEAAETQADLEDLFAEEDPAEIQEAGERIDAVCVTYQGLADDNNLGIDLECEE